jgi:hypothetical protein
MDAKNIKCLLEWCKKHETMFSIVDILTIHILGIVNFQIEIETIFSLVWNCHQFEEMLFTIK